MIHAIYNRKFTLERVVDGDTVVGSVDNGFYTSIKQSFRLHGINAPELNSPDQATRGLALVSMRYVMDSMIGRQWLLRSYKPVADKYGRFLAELFEIVADDGKGMVTVEDESLNARMVRLGYAVGYMA